MCGRKRTTIYSTVKSIKNILQISSIYKDSFSLQMSLSTLVILLPQLVFNLTVLPKTSNMSL